MDITPYFIKRLNTWSKCLDWKVPKRILCWQRCLDLKTRQNHLIHFELATIQITENQRGKEILFRIFWSRLKLQRKINRIRTKTVFFFLPFLTGADTFDWLKPYFLVPDGVGYAELQEKMHTNGLSWTVLIQSHTYTANQVVEILSVRKFWFKTHIWIFW